MKYAEVNSLAFERFTATGKSFTPRATLSFRGLLSLNEGACRRFKITGETYGVLYFDRETQKVAIELTQDKDLPGAKKFRVRKTGADMAAKAFLAFFHIDLAQTTMYDVSQDASTGWLVLDMTKGRLRNANDEADGDPFAEE